ncbi:hypothetical protein SKAU_G00370200 [Synaphobranchus kaupii]|uniref:Uncharacterized protein n=1 Tax=Synaphobranchus kaupii TaxID=118154 RepID=A0A9Q1IFU1_SYNKA|nr:hypothetical protein SKAU_G00370200 [Synaphobranchus kaupii]
MGNVGFTSAWHWVLSQGGNSGRISSHKHLAVVANLGPDLSVTCEEAEASQAPPEPVYHKVNSIAIPTVARRPRDLPEHN